jgi:cytidylate kinase
MPATASIFRESGMGGIILATDMTTDTVHPGESRQLIVAIDGPSGAGKGTVARAVAAHLGYRHVDTGAMYRAVAWNALRHAVNLQDEAAVAALARMSIIDVSDGAVSVDGHDVRTEIRTAEIDTAAAAVARLPKVREVLIVQQRDMGSAGGVVMEGRDIGTVVFPAADVKVYLDASPEERARRRATDVSHAAGRGTTAVAEVASALEARDASDRTRAASPLTEAVDALRIDTTGVPIDEVVARVLSLVKGRSQP